jgi:Bacterial type II/III secretion system short domain
MHTITASTIAFILASGLAGAQTPVADGSPASDTARVPGVDRALGEDTVIRTFVLEHTDPKEVDRLLRSLLGVRNLAVQERLNAVVIRDTGGIMPAIERLIEIVDQPRGEVDVEVELLRLRRNSDITAADLRMGASEFLALGNSEGAKSITRSTLSVMEAGSGRLHLESGKPRSPSTQFDLILRARQHPATEEITLEVTAELLYLGPPNPDGDRVPIAWNQTESALRLAVGETAVLRFPDTDPDFEIAIALTPAVIRASKLDAGSLEAFSVGAEAHLSSPVLSDQTP